jgi:tetratricopeptide (TPR) repeat protein
MTTDEQSIRDLKTSEAMRRMGVVRAEQLLVCVLIWAFAVLAVGGCATAPQAIPAPPLGLDEQIETGLKAYHQGHHDNARRVLRAALQEADRGGVEDLRVAAILNIITAIDTFEHYGSREWYAQQPIALDRMLAIAEKALGPEHPDLVLSLTTVAGLHLAKEKRAQAEPLVNRALAIEEKTLGPEHPNVAVTRLQWRAEIVRLRQRGEFAEMESLLRQALNIQAKALGPENPKLVESLGGLAGLIATQGQHAQAESLLKRALAIQEKALGPEHPDLAVTLGMLIRFYVELGKPLEESMVRRTAAFRERPWGVDPSLRRNRFFVAHWRSLTRPSDSLAS